MIQVFVQDKRREEPWQSGKDVWLSEVSTDTRVRSHLQPTIVVVKAELKRFQGMSG